MKIVLPLLCLLGFAFGSSEDPESEILNPSKSKIHPSHSAEFNNGKKFVEGDMLVKGNPEDRNAIGWNGLWPNAQVPYVMDNSVDRNMRGLITQAINDYNKYTCVRFVPRRNERDYVWINSRSTGCYAYLGRTGGQQPLHLESRGCADKGTVIHEMLHTIGFGHEQARNDRDSYITVNWQNITPNMRSQFAKMRSENNQGFPYDYMSVMHYPDWGFSANGYAVITTRDRNYQKKIGQRLGFSKTDVAEVNKLYRCRSG